MAQFIPITRFLLRSPCGMHKGFEGPEKPMIDQYCVNISSLERRRPMKLHTWYILTLLAIIPFATHAQELRILSSDASGITIEYKPQIRTTIETVDGISYTRYDVSHSDLDSYLPGAPMLPRRNEMIAMPGLLGYSVTVLQADYRDEPGVTVLPLESHFTDPESKEQFGKYLPGTEYTTAGWQPARNAEITTAGISRDQVLGSLQISPVQWDASRSVARMYTKIVVRVNFGPRAPWMGSAKSSRSSMPVDVLNPAQANNWRGQPKVSFAKTSNTSMATGKWYAIPVKDDGVYKLTKQWFVESGIDISSVDPRTFKLFGNGGKELSTNRDSDPMEGFSEIAIEVVGEIDGSFDDNDYVLFVGKGLSGHTYDAGNSRYLHYIHRFGFENSYLFTFGNGNGKRMQSQASLNQSGVFQAPWFTGRKFVEDEQVNLIGSGKLWLSSKMTPGLGGGGNSKTYTMKLDGLVENQPITYRMMLYSRSDFGTTNSFTVTDNGVQVATVPMGTVPFGTDDGEIASDSGIREYEQTLSLPDSRSVLTLTYNASDPSRNFGGYVDWIEWNYPRRFLAQNDQLWFNSPDMGDPVEFTLNGFSMSDLYVYDITAYDEVSRITNPSINGGTLRFQALMTEGSPREYVAIASPAFSTPGAAVSVENTQLQSSSMEAQFIIITRSDFMSAAERLKEYREQPGLDMLSTRVVTLSEIYSAFNCGVPDPTAIRNFLSYAVKTWNVKPEYVLFFGDGHYDYKNYTTQEPIIVPTWQSENSTTLILTYPTDDYYVQIVGNDALVDLVQGRIPVGTIEEAETAVSKIISYETESNFGPWRNKVSFVADDHITNRSTIERFHTTQSETIATDFVPRGMEVSKIYTVSYKTENTAQGRTKPEANRAIIDQINQGTLAITYTGHGSESVWSHEGVLVKDVSIPQMNNADRLTFVSAATCTFGLYDSPGLKSGTEEMMLRDGGGAIASLTAPRVVYAEQNFRFNKEFHGALFVTGRELDGRARRMGDALWRTKQIYNNDAGYEKFHLFGDPTLRLLLPQHQVSVDRILVNGVEQQSDTVQLKALAKVTFEASVRTSTSDILDDFNGTAQVSLYDSDQEVPVPEFLTSYSYKIIGGLLYRGQATIENGRFSTTFIVPKDISYENRTGRMTFYVDNQAIDGAGYTAEFRVGGSDTTGLNDPDGPVVDLFMDSRAFQSGDIVNENSTLLADLFDGSGINTTGLGIGHNIEVWLNDAGQSLILNDYYRGDKDSYQKGVVEYPFKSLPLGMNTVRMRVWDIFNNSTTSEMEFNVVSSAELSLANVYNVPNPMTEETVFTFQYNRTEPVDAEIKIYTLSGRLIKTIEQSHISDRFVRIPWDGKDADGDRLANGVYFYKVVLRSIDGGSGSEALGKLSVLR
jgi:peptidase C25-like protein/flagellar hook capping protein FlgD